MTIRLFSGPLSMFGAKAQIAAREKGVAFELVMVPFDRDDHYQPRHPEVLRINPKAQVPVLIDGTLELFDSTQIFEYLEDKLPTPALWPAGTVDRARARLLEHQSDEVFFPQVVRLFDLQQAMESPAALGACAAEIGARVGPARRCRQGAGRSPGWPPGQARQRRMRRLAGPTRRAGVRGSAIRCCRLVVWRATRPRQRLGWHRPWPRRGPRFLPRRLLAACAACARFYAQLELLLERADHLAGPYSFADIAFYMAQVFAERKGALMTDATPRLVAWRERVGARPAVRAVVGPMMAFLASQGRPVPQFLQSHLPSRSAA